MKKVVYFARFDESQFPGISKKIRGLLAAFQRGCWEAECLILPDGLRSSPELMVKIMQMRDCLLIFRNTFSLPLFLFPLLIARMRGCRLVLDIPTPVSAVVEEFKGRSDIGRFNILLRKLYVNLIFPWGLMAFHRIIQYSHEAAPLVSMFSYKTKILSNGFDVRSCTLRQRSIKPIDKELTLLGVAKLSYWHGFDRVIAGIGEYRKKYPDGILIKFIVIGDGEVVNSLRELAASVGVDGCVIFPGFKSGDALDEYFSTCDLGVASLGLYRIGIDFASVLKSREYASRGLPFINSGTDPDFNPLPSFVFNVANNASAINFSEVLDWYGEMVGKNITNEDIRSYALDHLDFDGKIRHFADA